LLLEKELSQRDSKRGPIGLDDEVIAVSIPQAAALNHPGYVPPSLV
jgi:hypothetical protein